MEENLELSCPGMGRSEGNPTSNRAPSATLGSSPQDSVILGRSGQTSFMQGRLVIWFSCGSASAVAGKLAIATHKGPEPIHACYCELANEHEDNQRFRAEVQDWWGVPIIGLRSKEYPSMDIYDVFKKERYIAGVNGATCTDRLKRQVRVAMQWPEDLHVFGYTLDETMPYCGSPKDDRIANFEAVNPAMRLLWILRDLGITKQHCYMLVKEAGIKLPAMYLLGYNNNNCIGCVKGGAGYWNKIRVDFPEIFQKMCIVSRLLGVKLIKLMIKGVKVRLFLDELPPDAGNYKQEGDISCGPQCARPDLEIENL